MNRIVAAALMTTILSGCFPATTAALKQEPSASLSFVVDEGYQSVYRKIATRMRACYESTWVGDNVSVRAELFTDIRKAEIAAEGINAILGKRVQLLVEIDALGENRTEVRAYQPIGKASVRAVRRWVLDGSTECVHREQS
jgi:hypothetical protein